MPLMHNLSDSVKARFSTFHVSVVSHIAVQYAEKGPLDFPTTLCSINCFDATDPRDKIFALIGITLNGPRDLIDYNRSLRELLINVCTRFFKTAPWLADLPSLDLLSFVQKEVRPLDLPSWIPTWGPSNNTRVPLGFVLRRKEWIDVGVESFSIFDEVSRQPYDALIYTLV